MKLTQRAYEEINPSTFRIVSQTYGVREIIHKPIKQLIVL